MKKGLAFSDVTLVPAPFCEIKSRKDVDTSQWFAWYKKYEMPVISSNMDSVYSPKLAQEMARMGGVACVHRFCSVEENIRLFQEGIYQNLKPWVSVGVGVNEFERGVALREAGAEVVIIDLANAACQQAVDQLKSLSEVFPYVVVGNFGTYDQYKAFMARSTVKPSMIKVSIGSGSMCTTRITTGVGLPSVTTLEEFKDCPTPIIFDGGITNSGDLSKAIALGAAAVMCGKLFAATEESGGVALFKSKDNEIRSPHAVLLHKNCKCSYPKDFMLGPSGEWPELSENSCSLKDLVWEYDKRDFTLVKKYRGSASLASYKVQGKEASFRAPEGESTFVEVNGTVEQIMNKLSGGLRSSMTYLNAKNLKEFRENARLMEVSTNSRLESLPHGKE